MRFPNLRQKGRYLYTVNAYPGTRHFEENISIIDGKECREFSAERSKLAAAISKNVSQIGFKEGNTVLYLGASHGYTPSFVSDIVGKQGMLFCIDIAPQVLRQLYFICEKRDNMIPMLYDCGKPETYEHLITAVDIVYQDIAQKNQLEIFLKNLRYLKKGGFGLLALKARSVDVTKKPEMIFKEVRKQLDKQILVVDYRTLDPFEKDHAFFVVKK